MNTVLIIDDDDQLRASFLKLLAEEGFAARGAASGEAGLAMVRESAPDVVVLDLRLPGMNGLETFRAIHGIEPKLPVIIMTAYGVAETAIEATKLGAFDYILKPFEVPGMLAVIRQALEAGRFMRSPVEMDGGPDAAAGDAIVGRSPAMQEVYKAIGRVAPTEATVLIRGESGTGKELAARAVYQHSLRKDKPFLIINCVAIPDTLLESELFGYEKGAFTGAVHRRVGKIEQAHGGTIFLDEIGDMPFGLQSKMLRLLQEKSIERLGGRETIPADVRIIAATNRDLETAIAENRFREDLYYRLKVVTLWLPPLAERAGDIPLLAAYFLARYARLEGLDNPGATDAALRMLAGYRWPGNVRELSNVIQKALIFNRGAPLSPDDVSRALWDPRPGRSAEETGAPDAVLRDMVRRELSGPGDENRFDALMDRFAALLVGEALVLTGGNRSRAARLLGVSRPTLHAKIEKYGIEMETSVK
jgi:DNA-binding NtrC family response regulator